MRLKLEEAAAAKAKAEAEAAASANAVSTDTPAVNAKKPVKRDKRKKTVSYATLELVSRAVNLERTHCHRKSSPMFSVHTPCSDFVSRPVLLSID